ncbi:MAG TPA: type VII secretion protein EssB [Bacillaceae bacterium]
MSEKETTYLEDQLGAVIKHESDSCTFIFQREKINLKDAAEMEMLKEIDPFIQKEIRLTDDELILTVQPPTNFEKFHKIKTKDRKSRWIFAHQLLETVKNHRLARLHLVVCPENIVFDQGLKPYFLHYGVKESIPPYEKDAEKLWLETKSAIAAAVDPKFKFAEYFKFHKTLELSGTAKDILGAENAEALSGFISRQIDEIEQEEKQIVHITRKKWNVTRYVSAGLAALLLPALVYAIYTLVFQNPKQEAYIKSQEYFLNKQYSEVVNVLSNYKMEGMPNIVLYELAQSYIINESLTEDQKEMVRNTVTLQSDPRYFQYWISVGRGFAEDAIDIARSLEDRDLIMYGLLKHEEQVKADNSLEGQEKQDKLKEIEREIQEYEKEMQEEETADRNSGN